jgi:hypothetical protein
MGATPAGVRTAIAVRSRGHAALRDGCDALGQHRITIQQWGGSQVTGPDSRTHLNVRAQPWLAALGEQVGLAAQHRAGYLVHFSVVAAGEGPHRVEYSCPAVIRSCSIWR